MAQDLGLSTIVVAVVDDDDVFIGRGTGAVLL